MSNTTPPEIHITRCDIDITVRQESVGTPTTKWGATRYCYPVTIIVSDTLPQTFDYCGSATDYLAHKDMLSESDLMNALECIMSDAIAGTYDCAEFFGEFGYEDPCEGLKAWQGCKKTLYMINELGISDDMLHDMIGELSEMA